MNILAIGAHFDDIEIGCGGTIARAKALGHSVFGYVASASGYNSLDNSIQRSNEIALEEGKKSASFLGYELIYDEFETTKLKNCDDLVQIIEKIVIGKKIDLILTHWINDVTEDHRAIASATAIATRKGFNVLMYKSNFYRLNKPFNATVFIDISEFIDKKKQAILIHQSEVEKFGQGWCDAILSQNRIYGQKSNCMFAEGFEPIKLIY